MATNLFKIEITIDADCPDQVVAMLTLIGSLKTANPQMRLADFAKETEDSKHIFAEKSKKTLIEVQNISTEDITANKRAEQQAKDDAAANKKAAEVANKKAATTTEVNYTIEQLRAEVGIQTSLKSGEKDSENADKRRAKIKAKLVELGANNVATLAVDKYNDLMAFLKEL